MYAISKSEELNECIKSAKPLCIKMDAKVCENKLHTVVREISAGKIFCPLNFHWV